MYVPTDLSVTGPQLVKLYKGYPVQISANALKNPNSRVYVHPETYKRIQRSVKKGAGCRICMTQDEILRTGPKGMSGSGRMAGMGWWSDAFSYLKQKIPQVASYLYENVPKAAAWVKENVIDTPLYQEKLKPIVHEKLHGKLEGLPYANVTIPAAEWIEGQTGLGVKSMRRVAKPRAKRIVKVSA